MAGRRKKGTDANADVWIHAKIKWRPADHKLARIGAAIAELPLNEFMRVAVLAYANKLIKQEAKAYCSETSSAECASLYIVKDDDGGIHGPYENREDAEYVAEQVHGIVHDT